MANAASVNYRVDKVAFSGNAEDFVFFMEQFESRMYILKLRDALLDKIRTPVQAEDEDEGTRTARETAESARDELQYRVWCELTQWLDRKSLMLVRRYKPDGAAAWRALIGHYKSTERPPVHKTLKQLTSLKMHAGERIDRIPLESGRVGDGDG